MNNIYLFIVNKKYTNLGKVAISSLLKTKPKYKILVYTEESLNLEGIEERIFDSTTCVAEHAGFNDFCNIVSYRIDLLDKLKYEYDNICILDVDTLFLRNMDPIFDYIGIAGVNSYDKHSQYVKHLKVEHIHSNIKNDHIYLNVGSCKLDCKLLRKYNLLQEFKKDLSAREELYTAVKCPEQDFINYLFHNDITCIPDEYNNSLLPGCSAKDIPRMFHFVGKSAKPWNITAEELFTGISGYYYTYLRYLKSLKDIDTSFCLDHLENELKKYEGFIRQIRMNPNVISNYNYQ